MAENETVTITKKRKRGISKLEEEFNEANVEPGTNSKYLRCAMASLNLPPIDIKDPKQVEKRISDYFAFCAENDRRPQLIGMANWLGINRATLTLWKRGDYRAETHTPIIERAINVLEELWVDFMQTGKIYPGSAIFLAKNLFGYKDVQDVTITPNNPLENLNDQESAHRLLEAIDVDDATDEV